MNKAELLEYLKKADLELKMRGWDVPTIQMLIGELQEELDAEGRTKAENDLEHVEEL